MNSILKTLRWTAGGVGGLFTFLFGGMDLILGVLITFIIADYATGILAALYNKELSSEIGYKGIFKKVGIIVIIVIAQLAGLAVGAEWLRSTVVGFYIANEGVSILENIGRMGIPFPKKLSAVLKQLKDDEE